MTEYETSYTIYYQFDIIIISPRQINYRMIDAGSVWWQLKSVWIQQVAEMNVRMLRVQTQMLLSKNCILKNHIIMNNILWQQIEQVMYEQIIFDEVTEKIITTQNKSSNLQLEDFKFFADFFRTLPLGLTNSMVIRILSSTS